jgi:hypothetical protein
VTYINLDLVTKLVARDCTPSEVLYYLVLREMMDEGVTPLSPGKVARKIRRSKMMAYLYLQCLEAKGVLEKPEGEDGGPVRRGAMLRDTVFRV